MIFLKTHGNNLSEKFSLKFSSCNPFPSLPSAAKDSLVNSFSAIIKQLLIKMQCAIIFRFPVREIYILVVQRDAKKP